MFGIFTRRFPATGLISRQIRPFAGQAGSCLHSFLLMSFQRVSKRLV
jgi:hypothetical protein